MTRRAEDLAALAIGVAALGLRLYHLDSQSYWYDESLSLLAARLPVGGIARYHLENAQAYTYPPLYSYVLHAWLALFGPSALVGRLFSAICGSGAVLLVYMLVRRFSSGAAGLLAAALLAVSQIGVAYSQETRAYAFALALTPGRRVAP